MAEPVAEAKAEETATPRRVSKYVLRGLHYDNNGTLIMCRQCHTIELLDHTLPTTKFEATDEPLCDVCVGPLGASSYSCDVCDFDVCLSCAQVHRPESPPLRLRLS